MRSGLPAANVALVKSTWARVPRNLVTAVCRERTGDCSLTFDKPPPLFEDMGIDSSAIHRCRHILCHKRSMSCRYLVTGSMDPIHSLCVVLFSSGSGAAPTHPGHWVVPGIVAGTTSA